jgi:hypothetical protein
MMPEYGSKKFQCPHCKTIASQEWFDGNIAYQEASNALNHLYLNYRGSVDNYSQIAISKFLKVIDSDFKKSFFYLVPEHFSLATCSACDHFTLWVRKKMTYPKITMVSPPNIDLNDDIKSLYNEASSILMDSPKGATALLRLALQKLLVQVGKNGKNINDDIKSLVAGGLSPKIQQALDLLRVVGNNAVHPGQINLDDNNEIAQKLFGILNFIADELISKPKELENLYSNLIPASTQEHIKKRDET